MDKNTLKKLVPLSILVFCLAFIVISLYLGLKQKIEDEKIYREFVAAQTARRTAEMKAYLTGRFDPALREDFVLIPKEYTTLPQEMRLRRETWNAFEKMRIAAALDGVDLKIASATRNFDYQKGIWDRKWTGNTLVEGKDLSISMPDGIERFRKILEYSAAPGTSRHHWGTDIDIYYAIPEYFESGTGKRIYEWLTAHAGEFGFCQVYDPKDSSRPAGYNEEKWHWSYLPLARQLTKEYQVLITNDDIRGFLGEEYVPEMNLVEDYVLGINPECL